MTEVPDYWGVQEDVYCAVRLGHRDPFHPFNRTHVVVLTKLADTFFVAHAMHPFV